MSNKKSGNENKNNENKVWTLASVQREVGLEAATYQTRARSLLSTAGLLKALLARTPEDLDEQATRALAQLEEAKAMTYAALRAQRAVLRQPMLRARADLVSATTALVGTLVLQAASPSSALAARAGLLLVEVFGPQRPNLNQLVAHDVWTWVDEVMEVLAKSPALRKRLEALAQPEAVAAMVEAHGVLGGLLGTVGVAMDAESVDARGVLALVHRRIGHYATCLLALATPGDAGAVARIEVALRPLAELRARLAAQARKGVAATAEEDEVEVDEEATELDLEEEEEEGPGPAPAVPAPPTG